MSLLSWINEIIYAKHSALEHNKCLESIFSSLWPLDRTPYHFFILSHSSLKPLKHKDCVFILLKPVKLVI